jgi:hypothetical protein
MYVGDSSVSATNGIVLAPGQAIALTADTSESDEDYGVLDLFEIFVDAAVNGDAVSLHTFRETDVRL